MKYVGVDGYEKKWLATIIDGSQSCEFRVYDSIEPLWAAQRDASLILIDIPIGLRESGDQERLCDKEARDKLGGNRGRGRSVFRVPCRQAVNATTYEKASAINKKITTKKMSCQTWGITPLIKQVDKFLIENKRARTKIRESHPELCFAMLNKGKAMQHPKSNKEVRDKAINERISVLCSVYPMAQTVIHKAFSDFNREAIKDDILDALVLAVTASFGKDNLKSLPEKPEIDNKSLPMQMLYYLKKD